MSNGSSATPTAERACADLGAEQFERQIGEAVDHVGRAIETRRRVHHAEDSRPGGDAVEVAERALQAAEDRQRGEARGVVGLFGADLAADLAERRRERSVGIERRMPGDESALADDAHGRERQPARRRLQRGGKNETLFSQALFDASHPPLRNAMRPIGESLSRGGRGVDSRR
jgi:hypothetical protein